MTAQRKVRLDERLSASAHVHCRQFDDEIVMLDLASGQYFALEGAGLRMWEALRAGKSPAEIAADLARDFDVAESVLAGDCLSLADDLLGRGLLIRSNAAADETGNENE